MVRADPSQVVHEILVGSLAAAGAVAFGPPGAVAGAAVAPVIVAALTDRGGERIDVMRSFALDEVRRRDAAGEVSRGDLAGDAAGSATELLEGSLLKARDAYESHKCKHLAYFVVKVLYDEEQDLGEALFHLVLAERLTYQQFILLRAYGLASEEPSQVRLSSEPFGAQPESHRAEILLPMLDLVNLGLMDEGTGDVPAVGALAARFDATSIIYGNPSGFRLSQLGAKFTSDLGMHLVPTSYVTAMELRLSK
jgi:hypothetical protein